MVTVRTPPGPTRQHRLEAMLLGGLALRFDGRPISEAAFRRRKGLLLLLRLLISPGHRLPTETVLEWLWPDHDPDAAAHRLRTVLSDLRSALPVPAAPNPVVRRDATLALDPALDLTTDVGQFEVIATSGLAEGDPTALRQALAFYSGPLLPSMPYEEWALERRAALARLHRQVTLALAAVGDAIVTEALSGLLAEDPADEEAGRALMRLLAGGGRRAEALRLYHHLAKALRDELGVDPGPETAALHAALLEPPIAPTAPVAPPASSMSGAPGHNLPAATSSFVGRAWELAELRHLLGRTRLLTLTGPGGVGKTRLALGLAEEQRATFPGAVWLVELAPLGADASVPRAVAQVLDLREEPGLPLMDTLASYLAARTALLLLDNCEHLVEVCAALAEGLLRACPSLRILATSRERLGLPGECAWPVPPLSLPPETASPALDGASLAQAAGAEAVQLFVERVRGVRPSFALTVENTSAVARVCRRLDGIPLALELAAARAGSLSVGQIADRLDDRFGLLTGGSRAALPRQRTLRASLDWSYDLLTADERRLLGRLAVFAGGWTLDAAKVVCTGDDVTAAAVLDLLDSLVAKSLVQADEAGGEARYRLLETVRQYAAERLAESGQEGAQRRDTHLHYYAALVATANRDLRGPHQAAWMARLDDELNNVRAALTWARQSDQPAVGLRLAVAMGRYWDRKNLQREGCTRLESLLAMPRAAEVPERAPALKALGALAYRLSDHAVAVDCLERSLVLYRGLDDEEGAVGAAAILANVYLWQGKLDRAIALYEETLAAYRARDRRWDIASSLNNLGEALRAQGAFARAAACYEESLAVYREIGDLWSVASVLNNLGGLTCQRGELDRAEALCLESLAMNRRLGDRQSTGEVYLNLGNVAAGRGDARAARAHYLESLTISREQGSRGGIAACLEGLARIAAEQQPELAARLFGAAEALRAECEEPILPSDRAAHEADVARARATLAPAAFEAAWEAGRALSPDRAIALAQGQ